MRYTYSRWDGTQHEEVAALEIILGDLADDLLETKDVNAAMAKFAVQGTVAGDGPWLLGLEQVLDEVRDLLSDAWKQPGVAESLTALEQWLRDLDTPANSVPPLEAQHSNENGEGALGSPNELPAGTVASHDEEPAPQEISPGSVSFDHGSVLRLLSRLQAESRDDPARSAGQEGGSAVELAGRIPIPNPASTLDGKYEQSAVVRQALDFLRRIAALEVLQDQIIESQCTGDLTRLDHAGARCVAGERIGGALERLVTVVPHLERLGYIAAHDGVLQLTGAGCRVIADKLVRDMTAETRGPDFGAHRVTRPGVGGEPLGTTRAHEYGDSFALDIKATVLNAVRRTGSGLPVRLAARDFEIVETESTTYAASVLLLDISKSMPARGCFLAAKKTVLALHRLLETQFPRDALYVAVFSDCARQIPPAKILGMTWADRKQGTNMQHGLLLARRLLGKHRRVRRQIILVTDGEPTAHTEREKILVSYPTTRVTADATLHEVRECTREGIRINTFLLGKRPPLSSFLDQVVRINGGEIFFGAPDGLGKNVLLNYVRFRAGQRRP